MCCKPSPIGDLNQDGAADILMGSQFGPNETSVDSAYIVLAKSLEQAGTYDLAAADYISKSKKKERCLVVDSLGWEISIKMMSMIF